MERDNGLRRIRWGVIGAGGIAARRTIPEGIIPARNSDLVALMDIDRGVAASVAAKHGVSRVYDREEDILNDPDVDAVYVATPVYLHGRHVEAAAQRGKHILCEKPLAATIAESMRLSAICRDAGVKLGIGLMMRYHGAHQRIKVLLEQEALGQVVSARAQLTCWYPPIEGAWRQRWDRSGGGALMDLGVHCVDLLCWFLGEVRQVCGLVDSLTHDYEVEDSATLLLQFESGAHATVEAFFNIPDDGAVNALELYGTKGCVLAQGTIGQEPTGGLRGYLASEEGLPYDPLQARDSAGAIQPIPYAEANTYKAEIEHFAQSIITGVTVPIGAEEACHALQVLEVAYQSSREGRFMLVPSS